MGLSQNRRDGPLFSDKLVYLSAKMPNKKNISKNDKKLLKNEKPCVSILA